MWYLAVVELKSFGFSCLVVGKQYSLKFIKWYPKVSYSSTEECKQYMEEEQINDSDQWLDEVDEMIFNFMGKVYSWLKETNKDDRCSKASSKTQGQ